MRAQLRLEAFQPRLELFTPLAFLRCHLHGLLGNLLGLFRAFGIGKH